jgi:beta-mannanase
MSGRRIIGAVLPLLLIAALIATYPLFERWFTQGLSLLRVRLAQLEMKIGLAHEGRGLLLGIYQPEAPYVIGRVAEIETRINKPFDIIAIYQTWGDRPEDEFPLALMRAVDGRHAMGMITWEPWTSEFRQNAGRAETARLTRLREIADGRYDSYVRTWAREAVIFGKPFFLRFAHEMDNPQYPWSQQAGNSPTDFIDAWRHVWTIFQQEGARNVVWVWSPQKTLGSQLYPGGEYVDWVGTGVFNYGVYGEGVWHPFEYLYEPLYRDATTHEKPIMIAEIGCSPHGGDPVAWYADAFDKLRSRYADTEAVVFYGNPADATLRGSVIDWSIDRNQELLTLLRRLTADGAFRN